jgi:hypothetical protein
MWRDRRPSLTNIRMITPILFITIVAAVFYITTIAPRISQASTQQFTLHNHYFSGSWYNHGGVLTIKQDGHAHFVSRVYRWCVDGPAPCDTIDGDTIIPGIQENIVFTREQNNTLYGTVTSSTDHTNGKMMTATLGSNDTLNLNGEALCGPKAPTSYCGA